VRLIDRITNYLLRDVLSKLDQILTTQFQLRRLIMGIKEDFTAFKSAVDEALTDIQEDIEALKVAVEAAASEAGSTPPEVAAQMAEITAKLEAMRNIYNPTEPPPVEPL
jgi:formiminotetrahydrofolate cyclodeaminase